MNLLINNAQHKQSFLPTLFYSLVILFLVLTSIFISFKAYYKFLERTAETSLEQKTRQGGHVLPPEGKDSRNYGLEMQGAGAEGITGHILFTSTEESMPGDNLQVYALSAREPRKGAYSLLPDNVQYGAFVEVKDVNAPTSFLLDTEYTDASPLSAQKEGERAVRKYDFSAETLSEYDSITGDMIRSIDWNPETNMVAYMRYIGPKDSPEQGELLMQNWEVVISNLTTDQIKTVLTKSVNPIWSPDGSKLLLLHEDGLYLYYLIDSREKRLISVENGELSADTTFDISPNGTRLALALGNAGVLIVYEISSWKPFAFSELGRIGENNVSYYYPQFSPDGRFYAIVSTQKKSESQEISIDIRAVDNRSVISSYTAPLSKRLFIDTWVTTLPFQ